jgi:hypothetical protein
MLKNPDLDAIPWNWIKAWGLISVGAGHTCACGGGLSKERAMSFRIQPRATRLTLLTLLSATVLLTTAVCAANARDFEMGGDGNYNIMAPEPGTAPHRFVRNRHARTSPRRSKASTASQNATPAATQASTQGATQAASPSIDTPEQIETFKRNRRAFASRGSSGLVLPTPPAGPTHYAPIGTPAVPQQSVEQSGPTILPRSGRAIPNLPHGPETFQGRASRCAFQSSINNIHAGQFGSYMASCM